MIEAMNLFFFLNELYLYSLLSPFFFLSLSHSLIYSNTCFKCLEHWNQDEKKRKVRKKMFQIYSLTLWNFWTEKKWWWWWWWWGPLSVSCFKIKYSIKDLFILCVCVFLFLLLYLVYTTLNVIYLHYTYFFSYLEENESMMYKKRSWQYREKKDTRIKKNSIISTTQYLREREEKNDQ